MLILKKRDRIAFACIAFLVLAGWIGRIMMHYSNTPGQVRVIRNGVTTPDAYMSRGVEANGKVNINTASSVEFERLPMIGPAKATAIIEYREKNGPFTELSHIMNVPGIGEGTFARIEDSITLGEDLQGEN